MPPERHPGRVCGTVSSSSTDGRPTAAPLVERPVASASDTLDAAPAGGDWGM